MPKGPLCRNDMEDNFSPQHNNTIDENFLPQHNSTIDDNLSPEHNNDHAATYPAEPTSMEHSHDGKIGRWVTFNMFSVLFINSYTKKESTEKETQEATVMPQTTEQEFRDQMQTGTQPSGVYEGCWALPLGKFP